MTPGVPPGISNKVEETFSYLQALDSQERKERFKQLDSEEIKLTVQVIDRLFTANKPSVDERRWNEIDQKLRERITNQPTHQFFPLFQRIWNAFHQIFAFLNKAFTVLADRVGWINTKTLERKVENALFRKRLLELKHNYESFSSRYRKGVEALIKPYFTLSKDLLAVMEKMEEETDADQLERLQEERKALLGRAAELSESIQTINEEQESLNQVEKMLAGSLPEIETSLRKKKQEIFERLKASVFKLQNPFISIETLRSEAKEIYNLRENIFKDLIMKGVEDGISKMGKRGIRDLWFLTPQDVKEALDSSDPPFLEEAAERTLEMANEQRRVDQARTPFYFVSDEREKKAYLAHTYNYKREELVGYALSETDFATQIISLAETLQEDLIVIPDADKAAKELVSLAGSQSVFAPLAKVLPRDFLVKLVDEGLRPHEKNSLSYLYLERGEGGELKRGEAFFQLRLTVKAVDDDYLNVDGEAVVECHATFVPHAPDLENLYYIDVEDIDWKAAWIDSQEAI